MQLMATPDAIESSTWLTTVYHFFHFESHRQLLIYFGIAIMLVIAFTNTFSIITTWLQYKFAWDIAHHLSTRLLKAYLNKPYSFYLKTNSSELRTYIISEVNALTGGVMIPLIEMFSRILLSLFIFGLLLWVDVKVALIMAGGLSGAYLVIFLSQKNFLKRIGHYRIDMNLLRFKTLQELLDGIKTIKVYNQEHFFYKRFHDASRKFCDIQPKYNIALAAPKNILEFIAFGSILGITIYLYFSKGNIQDAIPRLSLYAVAGYKLLPALQRAFSAAAKLRHNYPVLDRLYDDLIISLENSDDTNPPITPLPLNSIIELDRINFSYENTNNTILKNLAVKIPKGQTVAFIGSTGSGKTTLVDIIVGLLHPVSGSITIDNININKQNIKSWRESLAYVSQDVFLFDDTILRNIVLGIEESKVDFEHLKRVTQIADIFDFISHELPDGFQTEIGERGVRLSGGQRQRLGLARALYANPEVLILDEATSALDSITEKGIIESLQALPKEMTTIIIAHRLSTVRHADCIYLLSHGKIIDSGTYQSLINTNETFKAMVNL